jgi:PTH1 family peptidyl-tRNA hydrolase
VLGDFSADDREWVDRLLDAFAAAAPLLAAGDDAGCMNKIALRMQPPKVASQEPSAVPNR